MTKSSEASFQWGRSVSLALNEFVEVLAVTWRTVCDVLPSRVVLDAVIKASRANGEVSDDFTARATSSLGVRISLENAFLDPALKAGPSLLRRLILHPPDYSGPDAAITKSAPTSSTVHRLRPPVEPMLERIGIRVADVLSNLSPAIPPAQQSID